MPGKESLYPEKFNFYEFELENEDENLFSFQTENAAVYNVIFKPSPYVLGEDAMFAAYVYELIIELEGNESAKGIDKLIPATIHAIFADFITEAAVTTFVCTYANLRTEGN